MHVRPFLLDVREQCIADVLRQRQSNLTARFATQAQHPRRPFDIAEAESGYISGPQPQASQ